MFLILTFYVSLNMHNHSKRGSSQRGYYVRQNTLARSTLFSVQMLSEQTADCIYLFIYNAQGAIKERIEDYGGYNYEVLV
jgi:hypothetical protein